MDVNLIITTQYYDENGKPKGGQEFHLPINDDLLFYDTDDREAVIKNMIASATKDHAGRFEYVSSYPQFDKPIILDGKTFETQLRTLTEVKYA